MIGHIVLCKLKTTEHLFLKSAMLNFPDHRLSGEFRFILNLKNSTRCQSIVHPTKDTGKNSSCNIFMLYFTGDPKY